MRQGWLRAWSGAFVAAAGLLACSSGDQVGQVRVGGGEDVASSQALTQAVSVCRNSHDPGCGPFHFDGELAPDQPMTVGVTAVPASPRVGEQVTFHLVLHDPDGVFSKGTTFDFGPGAIGSVLRAPCAKFGAWDAPVPDPTRATEEQDVGHVYTEAGTYTARFTFEAGPDDCIDTRTGRGEHPYASTATGEITVVVQP